MDTSLLVLVWVAIIAILLVSGFVIVTMIRLQEFLREAKETVDNLNTTSSLVEKMAEQAAKGFFTITAALDGLKVLLSSFIPAGHSPKEIKPKKGK